MHISYIQLYDIVDKLKQNASVVADCWGNRAMDRQSTGGVLGQRSVLCGATLVSMYHYIFSQTYMRSTLRMKPNVNKGPVVAVVQHRLVDYNQCAYVVGMSTE